MKEVANFLPANLNNGHLRDWEIVYRDKSFHTARHIVNCKNIANALKSFDRAVPRHGKILKVRPVKVCATP